MGISIHVPRERDDVPPCQLVIFGWIISIHVPRERDDFHEPDELPGGFFISIHVPRERDDRSSAAAFRVAGVFQSTSLVRGTTGTSACLLYTSLMATVVPLTRDVD